MNSRSHSRVNIILSCTRRSTETENNQDVPPPASLASPSPATIARRQTLELKQQNTVGTSTGSERNNLLVLGVCGGIASGKSKACQILTTPPPASQSETETKKSEQSEPQMFSCFDGGCIPIVGHIDVDKLAHTVYEPGSPIISEVIRTFGKSVLNASDGTIDRAALGSIVFSDRSQMSVSAS
jgi:hypothetical protein